MSTVRDLIKGSMRLIGAIATGETPSAEEQADALSALNDMLDSWSTEGLIVHATVREEFSLASGEATRTMGTGGDFNTTRPIRIERAGIEIQSGDTYEIPVEIISLQQWAAIPNKSLTADNPSRMYIEGTTPLETINLWPVPTAGNKLVLYSEKPLTTFTSASTSIQFPPGYMRALRYNLAIELAPEFGRQVSAEVAEIARESKETIKRRNVKPPLLSVDTAIIVRRGTFDIYKGE